MEYVKMYTGYARMYTGYARMYTGYARMYTGYARMYTSMPGCIRVCQDVYEYARMYQTKSQNLITFAKIPL